MEEAEKVLNKKYAEYKSNAKAHSGYKDEWELFWKRRYKELRAGK